MSPGTSLIRSTRRARSFDSSRPVLRVVERLEKLLWFQDEPVHTMTAVVGYQLMRLAASHGIRVVLNGQGADETIGGYSSYFQTTGSLIRQGRMGDAWRAINGYSEAHGGVRPNDLRKLPPGVSWKCTRFRRIAIGHKHVGRQGFIVIRGLPMSFSVTLPMVNLSCRWVRSPMR